MDANYYDLLTDRVYVKKFGEDIIFKHLRYPNVVPNIYLINQNGILVNVVSDTTITPNKYGMVDLSSSMIGANGEIRYYYDRYRVVDLIACNFIQDSDSYIERGYLAVNKDGNLLNNRYSNIEYVLK